MNAEIRKLNLAHKNMIDRCYNENNASYKHYGYRGIRVCDLWLKSRDEFISWSLANGHDVDLSLDRIDNNADYSPENCRWADIKTQLTNQRRNRRVEYMGVTRTISQWAEEIGVSQDTIHKRLSRNISIEKVLTPGKIRNWKHGTRAGYEGHNCRCDLCKESNNKRHRERRAMKKQNAGIER